MVAAISGAGGEIRPPHAVCLREHPRPAVQVAAITSLLHRQGEQGSDDDQTTRPSPDESHEPVRADVGQMGANYPKAPNGRQQR